MTTWRQGWERRRPSVFSRWPSGQCPRATLVLCCSWEATLHVNVLSSQQWGRVPSGSTAEWNRENVSWLLFWCFISEQGGFLVLMASVRLLLNTFYFLKSWKKPSRLPFARHSKNPHVLPGKAYEINELQIRLGGVFWFWGFTNVLPGSWRVTSSVSPLTGDRVKAHSEGGKTVLFPKPYTFFSPGPVLNWVIWKLLQDGKEITTGFGQSSVEIIFWWQLGFYVILTSTKILRKAVWYMWMIHPSLFLPLFRQE